MLVMALQGILTAAVHEGETFSFCMCNPPFFQSLKEAGRNPSTAYAGNNNNNNNNNNYNACQSRLSACGGASPFLPEHSDFSTLTLVVHIL